MADLTDVAATSGTGSLERPVFFVHVMKTGGTTLFRNLRGNFELDELYPYRHLDIQFDGPRVDVQHHLSVPYLLGLAPERHSRIRVYTGHFPFVATELLGGPFTTVTLLRDPIERTISLLRQFRRKAPWLDPSHPVMASHTLEEVYEQPIVFEPLIHNHQTKIFSMDASDEPQSYMDVIAVDAARLDVAKRNLASIDVLGLTERYDDFLRDIEARFGWVIEPDARANATPASEIEPVSEALRRRIAEDNPFDVELYEYARGLVDLRRARAVGA
jgi:Sulfotransferase family